MTFRKKVFVSQKITLLVDGREVRVQALVSTYGAKYVFEEAELPEPIRRSADREIEMIYKSIPARCHVVKEVTAAGVIYSFRFVKPSGLLLRQIERDVKESGLPSPWIRSLPRLSARAKHLPVPALAILDYRTETVFLNVLNFTLGGLLVEYTGDLLKSVDLGTRFDFDLVTNGGEKITELSAQVSHVSTEVSEQEGNLMRVQIGLRFLPMNELSDLKYRSLIKDHCLGLKEGPAPGIV